MTEPEEGSGPTWRPEGEFNPHVAFEIINSCNPLSEAGSDGLWLSPLLSNRIEFGQEHFGAGSKPSGGGLWMNLTSSRRSFGSSFCSQTSRLWRVNVAWFVWR